jgi:RimJ/RimL family protein N-acetyltransferase
VLDSLTTATRDGLPVRLTPLVPADVHRVWELCQDPDVQRWTTLPSPYPMSAAEDYVNERTPPAWRQVAAGKFSLRDEGPELVWAVRLPGPGSADARREKPPPGGAMAIRGVPGQTGRLPGVVGAASVPAEGRAVGEVQAEGPLAGLWGTVGLKRPDPGMTEIGWWLGAGVRGLGVMRAAVAEVLRVTLDERGPLRAEAVWWFAQVGNLASVHIATRTGFKFAGLIQQSHYGDGELWSAVLRRGDPIAPRHDWPDLGAC